MKLQATWSGPAQFLDHIGVAMAMSDEILTQISMPDLAARLGTDEASARQAVETALPALLAGVSGEAANPNERDRLATAAGRDHDPMLLDADDPLAQVDTAEGHAIVNHLFGDKRGEVETQLKGLTGGGGSNLVSKVLPILAPLVMSWVARKMTGAGGSGGGLGDILGQVLGDDSTGSSGSGGATSGGGGLGDILGEVVGGATGSGGTGGGALGDIGDILGKLGGGTAAGSADGSSDGSSGGGLGDILGQLGGQAGGGGGLDDLLGSILGGVAKR